MDARVHDVSQLHSDRLPFSVDLPKLQIVYVVRRIRLEDQTTCSFLLHQTLDLRVSSMRFSLFVTTPTSCHIISLSLTKSVLCSGRNPLHNACQRNCPLRNGVILTGRGFSHSWPREVNCHACPRASCGRARLADGEYPDQGCCTAAKPDGSHATLHMSALDESSGLVQLTHERTW